MSKSTFGLALCAVGFLATATTAHAVVLDPGQSARLSFTATTATAPFDFADINLMFSAADPFGTNETLSYTTFDANNVQLVSSIFSSGSSVYTSGLFGQLTRNAIAPFNPATELTTNSFSVVVTAVSGSFDLTGATADFEHVIFTSGPSQFGVPGVFATAVPEPAAWAPMAAGLAGLGFVGRRRKRTA